MTAGGDEGSPSDATLPLALPPGAATAPGRRRAPTQKTASQPQRVRLRWEKLGPGALEAQGTAFGEWVVWLVETYVLWEIWPTCWHRHPRIVEELTALWAWHLALDADQGGDGAAAMSWHAALWRFLDRSLPAVTRWCLSTHQEPPPDVAQARRDALEVMRTEYKSVLVSTVALRRGECATSGGASETEP